MRQLAEALKEQRRRICEREPLDEMATAWWQQRQEGLDVQHLWLQWRLKNDNKLWAGLRLIDSLLKQLPGDLYGDIGHMDVALSRLYYLNTPRKAFQSIMALLMLRCLTCRELGIDMCPLAEGEYERDGIIKNPLEIPTTIGRVVAFGETHCDKAQRQTIELLVHWLRDDYELAHCEEIEALAEDTQLKLANAMEMMANKKTNAFTVYPQPGSTANLGCDQKNSDFKTYLPKADGSEEQSMLESNKKGEEDVKIIK